MSVGEIFELECACLDVMRMRVCVLSVWIATPIMPFFLAVTCSDKSERDSYMTGGRSSALEGLRDCANEDAREKEKE